MKVYVVLEEGEMGGYIRGVYNTKEKAELYIAQFHSPWWLWVEEWDVA